MIEMCHFGNAEHLKGTSRPTGQQIYDAILAQESLSNESDTVKSAIEKAAFLGWLPMIQYIRICTTVDQSWLHVEFREPVHRRTIEVRNTEINNAIQDLHAKLLEERGEYKQRCFSNTLL